MGVIRRASPDMVVPDIAARDSIPVKVNGMIVTVLDSAGNLEGGPGKSIYRWNTFDNKFDLIFAKVLRIISFMTEEVDIISGFTMLTYDPIDLHIWDITVMDGSNIIEYIRYEDLNMTSRFINSLGLYEGFKLRCTYAYPSFSLNINDLFDMGPSVSFTDVIAAKANKITTYTMQDVDNMITAIGAVALDQLDNTADRDKNVKSATKLISAVNISAKDDAIGSTNFNGTSDVNINLQVQDDSHFHTLLAGAGTITNLPTTLAGYGITNAYTKTEFDARVAVLSPVPSMTNKILWGATFSHYGITDTYTKTEADTEISNAISAVSSSMATLIALDAALLTDETDIITITAALANKVDIVSGMQLSSNDYTSTDRAIIVGAEASAQKNAVTSVAGRKGVVVLSAADVGLSGISTIPEASKQTLDATKFATPRNISIASHAVGDADFDGTADITIDVEINDFDTHRHTLDAATGNITDLPTTVAGYGITDVYDNAAALLQIPIICPPQDISNKLLSSTPTTAADFGITDGQALLDGSEFSLIQGESIWGPGNIVFGSSQTMIYTDPNRSYSNGELFEGPSGIAYWKLGGCWVQLGPIQYYPVGSITGGVSITSGYYDVCIVDDNNNLIMGGADTGTFPSAFSTSYTFHPAATGINKAWEFYSTHFHTKLSDNSLWSCGINAHGQSGLGNTTDPGDFTQVLIGGLPVTNVIKCASGVYHSLILRDDGSLWSCGYNGYGELGLNDYVLRNVFTDTGIRDVADIYAGYSSSYIIKSDGSLWSCGYNSHGCLGLGNTTQKTVFTNTGITNIRVFAAYSASYSIYIIKQDNTLWSCGYNGQGQLGLSDTTSRTSFTIVPLGDNVKSVACGDDNVLVVKYDNSVYGAGAVIGIGIGNSQSNVLKRAFNSSSYTTYIEAHDIIFTSYYASIISGLDGKLYGAGFSGAGLVSGANIDYNYFTEVNFPTWSGFNFRIRKLISIDLDR